MMNLFLLVALFATTSVNFTTDLNYSNLDNWAAHPDKEDMADGDISKEIIDNQDQAVVDVFFVHPTTFTSKTHRDTWNADINDTEVNESTDSRSIKNQDRVFSGSARVYAPRYRQAHLKAFFRETKGRGKKALDLAREDVAIAFNHYINKWNQGRPFIIASHSQGTRHAERLIKEYINDKDLQSKLLAAYLVGGYVEKNTFSKINVCDNASSTGCFVAWRTFDESFKKSPYEKINKKYAVVNPINWTLSESADKSENLGTYIGLKLKPFIVGKLGARISNNQVITDASDFKLLIGNGNLHKYDYRVPLYTPFTS